MKREERYKTRPRAAYTFNRPALKVFHGSAKAESNKRTKQKDHVAWHHRWVKQGTFSFALEPKIIIDQSSPPNGDFVRRRFYALRRTDLENERKHN